MAAVNRPVLHMYHTEGAGGGHAPDLIKSAAFPNILPSSTNPTLPYTHTVDEHLDMVMITHHLNAAIPRRYRILQIHVFVKKRLQLKMFCKIWVYLSMISFRFTGNGPF